MLMSHTKETVKPSDTVPVPSHTPWLTRGQAAAYLQVSESTITRMENEGRIPVYTVPGNRIHRFLASDLDKAMIPV